MDRSTDGAKTDEAEKAHHKPDKIVIGLLIFCVAAVAVASFAPEIREVKSVAQAALQSVLRKESLPEAVREQSVRAHESDAQRKQAIRILGLYAIGMPMAILFLLLVGWVLNIWPATWHLSFLHYVSHPQ